MAIGGIEIGEDTAENHEAADGGGERLAGLMMLVSA